MRHSPTRTATALLSFALIATGACGPRIDPADEVTMQPGEAPGNLPLPRRQILYHEWGPGSPGVVRQTDPMVIDREGHRPAARPPEHIATEVIDRAIANVEDLRDALRLTPTSSSPGFSLKFAPGVEGVDPMVAVGKEYLVVTQDHRIAFFDRQGKPLPPTGRFPVEMTANSFFRAFIAPKNPDGSPNLHNINRYLNFPEDAPIQCDLSDTTPQFPCVNEFYDTRALYDPFHNRFIILSAARHQLWPNNPNGELTRRYFAVAVSKTEDPRDGFRQWMLTWSNPRDWPWMAVSGDHLVVAHKSESVLAPHGPVAVVFHLPSMVAGDRNPPRFFYMPSDFGGNISVAPARHYPGESDPTFFVRRGKGSTREIFAFETPSDPWKAPPLMSTSVPIRPGIGSIRDGVTYRNGKLHYVSAQSLQGFGLAVYVVRIPVKKVGNQLVASTDAADGYYENMLNLDADPSLEHRVSREVPSSAVNRRGDMLIAYGRYSTAGDPKINPEVRYAVWYGNEPFPRSSWLLQAGELHPVRSGEQISFYDRVDYSTVVVDPVDGLSFWIAHEYGASGTPSDLTMVVGRVTP